MHYTEPAVSASISALHLLGPGALSREILTQYVDLMLADEPESLQKILVVLASIYRAEMIATETFAQVAAYARDSATLDQSKDALHLHKARDIVLRQVESASGPLPPAFILRFLVQDWKHCLAAVRRDYGETSEEWEHAFGVTSDLLWSIAPKSTRAERQRLSSTLNSIVVRLKQVMTLAGADASEQAVFLDQLAQWHVTLMSTARTESGRDGESGDPAEDVARAYEEGAETTIKIDVSDPKYRELLDLLNSCNLDRIDL